MNRLEDEPASDVPDEWEVGPCREPSRWMDDGTMQEAVHQCPYCDLRFTYHNEVKEHVLDDHPDRAEVVATIEPHELPR